MWSRSRAIATWLAARAIRGARAAYSAGRTRGYAEALEKLEQLQSNRSTTRLFGGNDDGNNDKASREQLNARAMDEMKEWLRRAGYKPQDLARMRHIHVAGTKGKGSVCAFATAMLIQQRRNDDQDESFGPSGRAKGSRVRQDAGGGVGTYTSPHLVSPRERIAINGEPLGQQAFADAFFELWDRFSDAARRECSGGGTKSSSSSSSSASATAATIDGPQTKPFFFRFMTVLAWHVFLSRGISDVVMECGIGGEYDVTNVLPAEAVSTTVVTSLGTDHAAMLGSTPEEVAWHKAGIMKTGVRCFAAPSADENVRRVLRSRAAERGAPLVVVDEETVREWGGEQCALMAGDFQKMNQALAVLAVREHLERQKEHAPLPPWPKSTPLPPLPSLQSQTSVLATLRSTPSHLTQGLREARIRGRCELLQLPDADWLLDGAHTAESLAATARWLARHLRQTPMMTAGAAKTPVILIFNQQERAPAPLLAALVDGIGREIRSSSNHRGVFSLALFTRNEGALPPGADTNGVVDLTVQRAAAKALEDLMPGWCATECFDNVDDAVARARVLAAQLGGRGGGEHDTPVRVLVTGSLHLVGGVLRVLEPDIPL